MLFLKRLRAYLPRTKPAEAGQSAPSDPNLLASREAITRFLFVEDLPEPVDLCFVLGCPTPTNMDPAIALHARGFAPVIMVCGHGPAPQPVPEAVLFRDYAVARGVPESAILLETESTNTRENFVFSASIIEQRIGWDRIRRVAIVSKPYHARRALMTARRHWPAHLRLVMQPSQEPDDFLATTWWETEGGQAYVLRELSAIGTYAQKGDIGGF
ncbi:YdcF family protein [Roseococcus pinisoli]|uniref:YdcF family protein n=1 Tax=Roseococcus pinisoli TaxID=2835040 RepID=A0ABS5QFY3_9PROT|nr:YdcF family protein [Roseococcus pinisoli]MBS7812216.1 YdcF family protein [Roseococcus pinisoli]